MHSVTSRLGELIPIVTRVKGFRTLGFGGRVEVLL